MTSTETKLVTCVTCGWVHFLLSRDEAWASIKEFNEWYETQSDEVRSMYGGFASMHQYERCFRCGSGKPMRWFTPGDCPSGCTLQPTVLGPAST